LHDWGQDGIADGLHPLQSKNSRKTAREIGGKVDRLHLVRDLPVTVRRQSLPWQNDGQRKTPF
jgi:hypothetical protein